MAKKIPDAITLIHINQYNTKTKFREKKLDMLILILLVLYYNTSDYNKFTSDILDLKIKQKELINKSDISIPLKSSDLNTKLSALVIKERL